MTNESDESTRGHTTLSRMEVDSPELAVVGYNGDLGISLHVNELMMMNDKMDIVARTQSAPEKSISRATFW